MEVHSLGWPPALIQEFDSVLQRWPAGDLRPRPASGFLGWWPPLLVGATDRRLLHSSTAARTLRQSFISRTGSSSSSRAGCGHCLALLHGTVTRLHHQDFTSRPTFPAQLSQRRKVWAVWPSSCPQPSHHKPAAARMCWICLYLRIWGNWDRFWSPCTGGQFYPKITLAFYHIIQLSIKVHEAYLKENKNSINWSGLMNKALFAKF